ncbi:MAG: AAA family ATPase [Alphaproteobacteria bacterium]|nr:AAA family ATPase [Alphaproteobacteria bacterium]
MPYFLNNITQINQFTKTTKEKYFIDKSNLIKEMNELVGTASQYVCITRPRRFGKTINAMMLASYYSKNADFKYLFDKLEISKNSTYLEHLNKHNVVYMTLNEVPKANCTYEEFIGRYINLLLEDLKTCYSDLELNENLSISDILAQVHQKYNESFIFIIDEWDYIFNNNLFSKEDRENFLQFLKDLLKDKPYVELAYMTGVLPIAKYSSGSALNMFKEYNMLNDVKYVSYFGFNQKEVEFLCKKQDKISLNELTEWYNGYKTNTGLQIYNPRSVCYALSDGICQSYWTNTGPMDEISYYIENNVEEVRNDIVQMVSGISVNIHLEGYGAEQINLNTRDEILSAMTVYGFLSYHNETLTIPNKELRMKFDYALKNHQMGEISNLVLKSNQMLEATLNRDTETMEALIEEAHDINIPVIKYNNENSLACVITLAYLSARSKYKIIREMPSGVGYADFIFYPNDKTQPAFILELKKNSTPEEALKQIRDRRYARTLKDYTGKKFAVGIGYDKKLKKHRVKFEDI